MILAPIEKIQIPPNRQRSEIAPEALEELVESIKSIGLLHLPVVRFEGAQMFLVSGERRLSAVKLLAFSGIAFEHAGVQIPLGQLPVTPIGELSEEKAIEVELEENIRRVDISVIDRSKAVARLHELRVRQASAVGKEHTLEQTASEAFPEVGEWGKNKVWRAVTIANSLEKIPELSKVKTEKEAMKLINRAADREKNERLAAIVGKQSITTLHQVHHADCTDFLASYKGEKFDCILIDPPYGMGAESFGDGAGRLSGITHQYADTSESFRALMGNVAQLITMQAKPESHLYCWCDIDGFHFLRSLFEDQGWYVFRTPLINIKREGGRVPLPEHGPRRAYEICLYAFRGNKPVTAIYPDVFESTLEGDNLGHGAQKPVEAYVNLLKRSCRPNDLVLDCFAGTGTIIAAAQQLKLRSVAVEKDAGSYGICLKRLEGVQ